MVKFLKKTGAMLDAILSGGLGAIGLAIGAASVGASTSGRASTWRGNQVSSPLHGGRVTKLNQDWMPLHYSGDAAIAQSWDLLTSRIRDLCDNEPVLSKLSHQIQTLAIGAGILTFSDAQSPDGGFLDDFADESDDLFMRWAFNEADISGRMSFFDMQRLSFKECVEVGSSLWLEVFDRSPGRTNPLSYQLLEMEQLDRNMDRDSGAGRTRISNGIEFDRNNRAIAYWLYDTHPYDSSIGNFGGVSTKSRRIPASRIIHNFLPHRISAHAGISWLRSLIQLSRDRDRYWANKLTSSSLQAGMAIHVKREGAGTTFSSALTAEASDRPGTKSYKLGYPAVIETGINEEIGILQAAQAETDDKDWLRMLHLHTAMGGKISLNRLQGDAGEAVFASIKASFLDDERTFAPIQQHQAMRVVLPIRQRHNELAAAMGSFTGVTPAQFRRNPLYQRFDWVAGGDPDLQPKDDGEAAVDRMRSGRTTPQYEMARLGFHWRKSLRDWKRFFAELDRLGMKPPDFSKGQGGLYVPFLGPVENIIGTGGTNGKKVSREGARQNGKNGSRIEEVSGLRE